MTRLFVHAVALIPEDNLRPETLGLRGRPLSAVHSGRLSAWGTSWDADEIPSRRADLLSHHEIVEAISQHVRCLPVRYGACLPFDRVAEQLERRQMGLVSAIDRLRGRRELAITLLWRAPLRPAPSRPEATPRRSPAPNGQNGVVSGREHLAARRALWQAVLQRRARAQSLARHLERELQLGHGQARHLVAPSDRVALSTALLVDERNLDAIKQHALQLSATLPDVQLLVNGPWPPYSFCETL